MTKSNSKMLMVIMVWRSASNSHMPATRSAGLVLSEFKKMDTSGQSSFTVLTVVSNAPWLC